MTMRAAEGGFGSTCDREKPDQHGRALRVPDEDDRPPVVVVGQVVLPRRQQALVGHVVGLRAGAEPVNSDAAVRWRYIGAQTRQTCENRDACAMAASTSVGWTVRSALADRSVLTVGYT